MKLLPAKCIFLLILLSINYNICKGNYISDNVKHIEVDKFVEINSGYCVVKRGDKFGLINMDGKFVIPYGKYRFITLKYNIPGSPILIGVLDDEADIGININPIGKVSSIIDIKENVILSPPEKRLVTLIDGYNKSACFSYWYKSRRWVYGYDGKFKEVYNVIYKKNYDVNLNSLNPGEIAEFSYRDLLEQFFSFREQVPEGSRYGVYNKTGTLILPFQYEESIVFSENKARVAKTDEFGVLKYGFVDIHNKPLIDFKFRIRPGNFHEGLALVRQHIPDGFDAAYIDSMGKIVIKIGKGESKINFQAIPLTNEGVEQKDHNSKELAFNYDLTNSGYFMNGYALWRNLSIPNFPKAILLLNKEGEFITFNDFVSKFNIDIYSAKNDVVYFKKRTREGFYFYIKNKTLDDLNGYFNNEGSLIFNPIYNYLSVDPKGTNAIASLVIINEKDKTTLNGIINKEGKYIVLPQAKSEW